MTVIREITKVKQGGTIEISNPALSDGEEVEVIVLLRSQKGPAQAEPYAFLKILEEAKLEGPPDWSEHLDEYLHPPKTV